MVDPYGNRPWNDADEAEGDLWETLDRYNRMQSVNNSPDREKDRTRNIQKRKEEYAKAMNSTVMAGKETTPTVRLGPDRRVHTINEDSHLTRMADRRLTKIAESVDREVETKSLRDLRTRRLRGEVVHETKRSMKLMEDEMDEQMDTLREKRREEERKRQQQEEREQAAREAQLKRARALELEMAAPVRPVVPVEAPKPPPPPPVPTVTRAPRLARSVTPSPEPPPKVIRQEPRDVDSPWLDILFAEALCCCAGDEEVYDDDDDFRSGSRAEF